MGCYEKLRGYIAINFVGLFIVDLRINETLQTGAVRKPHLPNTGNESVYLFFEFTIVFGLNKIGISLRSTFRRFCRVSHDWEVVPIVECRDSEIPPTENYGRF